MAKKKAKKAKKKSVGIAKPTAFNEKRFQIENAADTMVRMQEINDDRILKAAAKRELLRRSKAIKKARGV